MHVCAFLCTCRLFEDGLTPRWVASKRLGWNTNGWESVQFKLAAVDSREDRLPKEQQDMTLELGRRKGAATRVEATRRGWASHRHSMLSRAHRQQGDSLLTEAFSAQGYAVVANTLSNEDAVCLTNFYKSRKQTSE